MVVEQLYQLIEDEDNIKSSHRFDLKSIVDSHPYFQAGIFAYLKSLYLFDNARFEEALSKYSIFIHDRKALFYYILSNEFRRFFSQSERKKELSDDKTSVLLNAFFETHDSQESIDLEYNLARTTLASADYFSYMTKVEKKTMGEDSIVKPKNLKYQSIIDSFIAKSEEEGGIKPKIDRAKMGEQPNIDSQPEREDVGEELNDNLFFTETLAKIYIKQRKYEKAYKIIQHLSLNYPKKNIYFADQLEFLEKLIINSKYKDKK